MTDDVAIKAILGMVYLGSILVLVLSIIILRLTLDRRIRKALPKAKMYNAAPDWYLGFGRSIMFGCAAIFNYANKSDIKNNLYDNFDVKSFANKFEKTAAALMYLSLFTFIFLIVVTFIADWLGIINLG